MQEHWKDLLLQKAGKHKTHLIKPKIWSEIHLFYLQCDLTNWGEKTIHRILGHKFCACVTDNILNQTRISVKPPRF